MTCHTDKCRTAHVAGDSSDDTFEIMNSELPGATEERNLEVAIDYSFKTSSAFVKPRNKDKTPASTKPQKTHPGVQGVVRVTALQEKEQLKKDS